MPGPREPGPGPSEEAALLGGEAGLDPGRAVRGSGALTHVWHRSPAVEIGQRVRPGIGRGAAESIKEHCE